MRVLREGWVPALRGPTLALILAGLAVALVLTVRPAPGARLAPERVDPSVVVGLSADRVDFGLVPFASSVSRQIELRNDGNAPFGCRLTVDSAAWRVAPSAVVLAPGTSLRITVALRAVSPGPFAEALRIEFEGGADPPLEVPLEGEVHAGAAGEPRKGPPQRA